MVASLLKIRPAVHSDAAIMMLVHQEAIFSRAGAHYQPATLKEWAAGATPDRIARVEQDIADPNFIILIAQAGDEVIGFAIAVPSKNELRAVYVKRNPIGKIGTALLADVEQRAFNAGAEWLACDASLNAEAFYKANGYAEESRADHLLSSGGTMACVRMKKACLT
jgi:putative acetyltransferase